METEPGLLKAGLRYLRWRDCPTKGRDASLGKLDWELSCGKECYSQKQGGRRGGEGRGGNWDCLVPGTVLFSLFCVQYIISSLIFSLPLSLLPFLPLFLLLTLSPPHFSPLSFSLSLSLPPLSFSLSLPPLLLFSLPPSSPPPLFLTCFEYH